MYRKKTVLMCDLSQPTTKPIGVVAFVSNGNQTNARVNVGGLHGQGKYYIYVECDGICCAKELKKFFNFDFVFEESQLEKISCLILKNDKPICFGSSFGLVLTSQFVTRAREETTQKPVLQQTVATNTDFTLATTHPTAQIIAATSTFVDKTYADAPIYVDKQPSTQTITQAVDDKSTQHIDAKTIDHSDLTDNKNNIEDKLTHLNTNIDNKTDETDKKANICVLSNKTECLDKTKYDDFVAETPDYFDGVELNVLDTNQLKKQTNVSLAEYSQALQRFYQEADGTATYYESVKDELGKVFDSYQVYTPLILQFKDSFFVKITDKKGRFFCLGLLSKDGAPTYICYALPKNTLPPDPLFTHTATVNDNQKEVNFCFIFQSAMDGRVLQTVA